MDMQQLASQLGVGGAPQYSMDINPVDQTGYKANKGSFFGNTARAIGHVGLGALNLGYHAIADPIAGLGHDIQNLATNNMELGDINTRRAQLDQQSAQLSNMRNTMAPGAWKAQMQALTQAYLDLSNEAHGLNYRNPAAAAGHLVGVAALPLMASGLEEGGAAAGSKIGQLATKALGGAKAATKGSLLDQAVAGTTGGVIKGGVKLAAKQALLGNPAGQQVEQTAHDVAKGKFGTLGLDAALLAGVPAGLKYIPKGLSTLKDATFGSKGILDTVFGDRIREFLAEHPEYNDTARIMQQFTKNQSGPGTAAAAEKLSSHLKSIGVDPKSADLEKEFKRAADYYKGEGRLQDFTAKNNIGGKALTLSHDVAGFRNKAAAAVSRLGNSGSYDLSNPQDRAKLANDVLKSIDDQRVSPVVNQTLRDKIGKAITEGESVTEIRHNLRSIEIKQKVALKGFRAPRGFMVTYAKDNKVTPMPKLESTPQVQLGREANEFLAPVGNAIRKVGLSAQSVPNQELHNATEVNFRNALSAAGAKLPESHGDIFTRLQRAANAKDVPDPRLLFKQEFDNALGHPYTSAQVKAVRKALFDAYAKLPPQTVGLGNWIVNQAVAHVPYEGNYLRIQTLLRYQRNPFFYGRQITKSAIIAMFRGGNPFGRASSDTLSFLEHKGYFQKSLRDIGASDFFGDTNNIKESMNQIGNVQKNIVGKLAEDLASNQGLTVQQAMEQGGPTAEEIDHAIRVTLGYPREGYISSPLAKTLNVLVFPSRFDTKVLAEAGKAMAKLPPVSQALLISDLIHGEQQLKSPEGQQWQRDNSELLGIIKYFTPVGTLQNFIDGVHGGVHIMDLGEVGGLPFGIIAMSLQHQGLNLGPVGASPYVDPKTGQIVPESIPVTLKGHLQQGALDLISSMFSYPGRQLGLSSKASIEKAAVGISANSKDFKSETPQGPQPTSLKSTPLPELKPTEPFTVGTTKLPSLSSLPAAPDTGHKSKRTKTVPSSLRINTGI